MPNAVIGMVFFLGTEVMFFAGLVSVFLILRAGAEWPPPGQPRLPVAVTGVNTLVLIASGLAMYRALCAIRRGKPRALTAWLGATVLLGGAFLAVQGSEWVRLVRFGLTFTSSLYAATFYTLIGAHGLHVLAALIVLLVVLGRAAANRYGRLEHSGVEACWLYWSFVVAVWPVLYVLVYLS